MNQMCLSERTLVNSTDAELQMSSSKIKFAELVFTRRSVLPVGALTSNCQNFKGSLACSTEAAVCIS